ncbi:MAG TPA: hypothetical protein PKU94_05405 [Candidatus Hydrothermia bacterium]|nr:hypothetical protein [Candidatus Hydrothermia bacterium]
MTILSEPSTLPNLISRRNLIFELGFGSGDFIVYLKKKYPEALVIGAEIANKYFISALKKLVNLHASDYVLYRGDGRTLLYFFVPMKSVDAIYINFPDPWEKPSREERRLVSKRSIMIYYSRLKITGRLYVATDSDPLKVYLRGVFDELGLQFIEFRSSPYDGFETKYARKWSNLRKQISYFIIKRGDDRGFGLQGEYVSYMPNFIFYLKNGFEHKMDQISDTLPINLKEGDFFYKIDRVYRSKEGEFLFRVFHSEPFLSQKYYILLRFHEGKAYMEIDDKNGLIISKWVMKTFKDLSTRVFEELGEEVIFQNFGSGE